MRKLLLMLLVQALGVVCSTQGASWHTDFGQAQSQASGENRFMLVYFTSSDECQTCMRLQEEVFLKPEFQTFADRHLVLVEVDFPRGKQMSPGQRQANRALAEKFMAHGFPVVLLLNSQGEAIGRMGYTPGGVEAYIRSIEGKLGVRDKATEPAAAAPVFSGAPVGPAPKYKELTLKSISGAGAKRLALINNQTFGVGESGKVRLGTAEVKVRVEEIRDKSVIVTLDGKKDRKELKLVEVKKEEPKRLVKGQAKAR